MFFCVYHWQLFGRLKNPLIVCLFVCLFVCLTKRFASNRIRNTITLQILSLQSRIGLLSDNAFFHWREMVTKYRIIKLHCIEWSLVKTSPLIYALVVWSVCYTRLGHLYVSRHSNLSTWNVIQLLDSQYVIVPC